MPPESPLPDTERATLREWIVAGADWPERIEERRAGLDWWSLQPLRDPPPPTPSQRSRVWDASPVDSWVLAALRHAALQPAPDASRRDLIRRVSYSLTGLPPSPEAIGAFEDDTSPDAYERLLDRLLASPHYGERWARHWLDLVRFAESEGFERDLPRDHAWPYRDYVIRSFNSDKSYLDFAVEQMAGDVIDSPTTDSVIATSMLTLGPVDAVGLSSAIPRERASIREDMLEEMVGTVAQTFLGLTVNCARCHDHKFDPIPQEEYYRMKSAFAAVWPPTRPVPSRGLDALVPHGIPALPPDESRSLDARRGKLQSRIEALEAELGDLHRTARPPEEFSTAPVPLARWTFDTDGRADFAPLHLRLVGPVETADGRLGRKTDTEQEPPEGFEEELETGYGVSRTLDRRVRTKTLEAWLEFSSVPEKGETVMEIRGLSGYRGASVDGIRFVPGDRPRWENSSIGQFRSRDTGGAPEQAEPGMRVHVAISYSEDGTIAIFRNGEPYGEPYTPDTQLPAGRLQVYLAGDSIVRFPASADLHVAEARLYDSALTPAEVAASHGRGIRDLPTSAAMARMSAADRERAEALAAELADVRTRLADIPQPDLVHGVSIRPAEPTHVLLRGSVDQQGKRVDPAGLSCVSGLSPELGLADDAPEGSRRRAVAEWIANPRNPLFARVIVNRVWQQHFGRGFVDSPSDFGYNGGQPSHPELLDWLASDLVRSGWSLKRLHKRILMSRTYRQSFRSDPQAAAIDGDNRLYWKFPLRRLDAEAVRDSMLAVSGDLNRALHGRSFRPFTVAEARGSLKRYVLTAEDTAALRRRTVYRMNVITAGDPMLEALDCPLPSVKTPRRPSTTTALQALSLMNNAFVQQRAAGFAHRLRREAPDLDSRIRRAFELALGRPPQAREMDESGPLVAEHGLEALCWGLFNSSEFLYVR